MAETGGRERMNRVVCKGRGVPRGWVVLGEYHNPACDGEGANSWIITRPGRRELVCADSPVPDGYRRVRQARCASCPGDGQNAWVIERQDGGG